MNFMKIHSLMDSSINAADQQPLYVKAALHERLTAIAVDPGVKTPGDDNADQYDVSSDFTKKLKTIF